MFGLGGGWRAIRRRLTYANVVASVALFAALGSGAYAALQPGGQVFHGCVDRSTGVLRVVPNAQACRGQHAVTRGGRRVRVPGEYAITWNQVGPAGPQGSVGASGPAGPPGPQGLQGVPGPFPDTLPGGKTLTGVYATLADQPYGGLDAVTFGYPQASAPTAHFIGINAQAPAECPGSGHHPEAMPGNLCVYAVLGSLAANAVEISNPETNLPGASERGFQAAGGDSSGTWAVTAP